MVKSSTTYLRYLRLRMSKSRPLLLLLLVGSSRKGTVEETYKYCHAGNIAVGNTKKYLPLIVKQVASASTPAGRLLFLHALREVSTEMRT